MKPTRKGPELGKLLNTCEDLQQIRSKMADPELERESRTRLQRQGKRKAEQLSRDLKEYTFRGPLADVMQSFPLAPDHFQILAVLLQRQMRCEDPALQGRLVLAAIFPSAFEALARVDLLHPDSPLRASGLVVPADDEEDPSDLLETAFVLSDVCLRGLRREIVDTDSTPTDPSNPTSAVIIPYANNREFLVDLRILHNLYSQRAERVFSEGRWNRLHHTIHEPGRPITVEIQACWQRIRSRLDVTPNAGRFPGLRLMHEYSLCEEEMIIVIHLLFKELFEGNAYADIAELLKIVSASELELIQNRRLAVESAPLLKNEILCIEPMIEGRSLTGEAYLSDWVVSYLFGASTSDSIRPDERIDWHMYLAELDDTQGFFRELDAN